MKAKNQSINVSVVGGWGSREVGIAAGIVDAGGRVIQVQAVSCLGCSRPFKVVDGIAVVKFTDALKKERAYHIDCLPVAFGFDLFEFAKRIRNRSKKPAPTDLVGQIP